MSIIKIFTKEYNLLDLLKVNSFNKNKLINYISYKNKYKKKLNVIKQTIKFL
jgi:hypothetical protein